MSYKKLLTPGFIEHAKRAAGSSFKYLPVLSIIPFIVALSACTSQVNISSNNEKLVSEDVTKGIKTVLFPDDDPSVADGKVVYEKMKCAECHSATGAPVAGKATVDLSNKEYARKQKPVDQYMFAAFGKEGLTHPTASKDALTKRETWDLVWYVRSLADPTYEMALSEKERGDIDAVFGGNCAVCHGKTGVGDGPLAKPIPGQANIPLEPLPANFQTFSRFYDRTDETLYDHIANGIKWEGMPNFLGKTDKAKNFEFNEENIWKLVKYVRHFHVISEPTIAAQPANTTGQAAPAAPADSEAPKQTETK